LNSNKTIQNFNQKGKVGALALREHLEE